MKPPEWSDPGRLAQMRALLTPPPEQEPPSFGDAVLNAIVFVAMVAAIVFIVSVALGLLG